MATTLIAMAPSGDVVIVRDDAGQVWSVMPKTAGGPFRIDDERAQRAVAEHGFVRVDREFADWASLDAFRKKQAALTAPSVVVDTESFDVHDVDRLLRGVHRWIRDGDTVGARKVLLRLLDVRAVREDPVKHKELLTLLEDIDTEPAADLPFRRPVAHTAAFGRYAYASRAA